MASGDRAAYQLDKGSEAIRLPRRTIPITRCKCDHRLVHETVLDGDEIVSKQIRSILGYQADFPTDNPSGHSTGEHGQ
jgi:hypothetical protein